MHYRLQNIPESDTHGTPQKRPPVDAWTKTPISAWVASVPIVPILRNVRGRAFSIAGPTSWNSFAASYPWFNIDFWQFLQKLL